MLNTQFFLLWVDTRISVKLLLLWGPSGSNLDNGLFYQINTAGHLSEAWLEKFPFVVKKMATNWLFCILCLQCHIWPALKDRQRRIKKKVSAVRLLPSWTSEIGGSQVCAADRPRASEGYLSSAIQPSTPSSARRPSHCSSQGGRFVWNDILGIRRIAGEQEICCWASQTSWNEKFRKNPAGEKQTYFIIYLLWCRYICSHRTSTGIVFTVHAGSVAAFESFNSWIISLQHILHHCCCCHGGDSQGSCLMMWVDDQVRPIFHHF